MDGDDSIRVFVGNDSATPAYFDDLRFFPADGVMTSQAYDSSEVQITCSADENNIPVYNHYDALGRLYETVNCDGKLLEHTMNYYSRPNHSDAFSATDPNYAKSMIVPADSFCIDFSYTDSPTSHNWTIYDPTGTMSTVFDPALQSQVMATQTGEGIGFGIQYPTTGAIDKYCRHLWFKIRDTDAFVYYVRVKASDQNEYYLQYEPSSGTPYKSGSYIFNYLGASFRDGCWHTVERDLERDLAQFGLHLVCVRWFCIRGDYYIDDIRLTDAPLTSVSFIDGSGRSFQTQTWKNDFDIVSKTMFNGVGQVDRQYFPQEISNASHAFISSVAGNYEQYEYHTDALMRHKRVIHPDGNDVHYDYGSEVFDEFSSFIGAALRYEQVTDEENIVSKRYFDKFGNEIGGIQGDGLSEKIVHAYQYDILGRVIATYPPNYFSPPRGTSTDWDNSTSTYSTIGRVLQQYSDDEGLIKFIYDNNGNLRFSQNAVQATANHFVVNRYDAQNRLILSGLEKNYAYNWSTTFPSIDDTTYAKDNDEWKICHFYDVNYVSGVANWPNGKLTKTLLNNNPGANPDTVKYRYDQFGNLVEKQMKISNGSPVTQKNIAHVYDQLGRETQTIYPSGNTLVRKFDATGKLEKVYTIQ